MPSRTDVELAAQLVFRGLVDRSSIEECIREVEGKKLPLEDLLTQRRLITREEIDRLRMTLAVERGEVKDLVPGYRIEESIGQGGMSIVFRAWSSSRESWVAIKVLRPELQGNPRLRSQFIREAKLLRALDHENIVQGHDLGRARGYYYFVMELIEGDTLLWYIDRKMRFDEDAALFVILQIGRALEYLREKGIVHRDIKPGNILLTRENLVKLCDLGLARRSTDATEDPDLTVGTVQYLSPEQARGIQDLDVRSDIYSLGCTLYHLVVGELPFDGGDNREILSRQILESLSSPEVKRKMSPHMHYFIEKMMAKDREIRYQDPVELIQDIEAQIRGKKSLSFNPKGEEGDRPSRPLEGAAPGAPVPAQSGRTQARRNARIRERLRIKRLKRKRQ